MHRTGLFLAVACLSLAGCGTVEYRDTNAEVDARHQCIGVEDENPRAAVPDWCKRESTATWTSREGVPAPDFGDDDSDDD